ncbi:hypothetical protein CRG98_023120, partial [Punica granatum]
MELSVQSRVVGIPPTYVHPPKPTAKVSLRALLPKALSPSCSIYRCSSQKKKFPLSETDLMLLLHSERQVPGDSIPFTGQL